MIFGVATLLAIATLATAVPPHAKLFISSWAAAIRRNELASVDFRLDGTIDSKSFSDYGNMHETRGSWLIVESGKRFRWEFHVPSDWTEICAYDGKRWYNYGDTPEVILGQRRGATFSTPMKVLQEDPRDAYVRGIAHVYPFTLEQILQNPFSGSSASKIALPDAYDAIENQASVTQVDGRPTFVVQYKSTSEVSAGGMQLPQTVCFEQFDHLFVPTSMRLDQQIEGVSVQNNLELTNYRKVAGKLFPSEIVRSLVVDGHVQSEVHLGISIRRYSTPPGSDMFSVAYPDGIQVYDDERGGYKTGTNNFWGDGNWLLPVALAGSVIFLGAATAIFAWLRRKDGLRKA